MPPSMVDSPSARRPSASCRGSMCLSTISPMASMSPVVSVMITNATTHIEMTALTSKVGTPKWNGVLTPNQASSPTWLKSVRPNGMAMMVPMISPDRMDSRARAGGAKRSITKISTRVPAAKAMLRTAPKSSAPTPPPAQPAATGISDRPMIKITVPVTSGGKNRSSLANTGASRIMNRPQEITAP